MEASLRLVNMVPVPICGREDWTILMPEERAARVQWPWHEWNRFHSMFHNLRLGDVLFDVGAEQGDQSALYQRWIQRPAWEDVIAENFAGEEVARVRGVREGGIVLVEPNLRAWPCIKAVWDANELRKPLGCYTNAISSEQEVSPLHQSDWPSPAKKPIRYPIGTAQRPPFETTIDHLTTVAGIPDAITIDIEGIEHEALVGAKHLLTVYRPLVWVSIHWELLQARGDSRIRLLDYMAGLGYRFEHLGADHEEHALFWHPEGRRPVLPYDGVMGA